MVYAVSILSQTPGPSLEKLCLRANRAIRREPYHDFSGEGCRLENSWSEKGNTPMPTPQ